MGEFRNHFYADRIIILGPDSSRKNRLGSGYRRMERYRTSTRLKLKLIKQENIIFQREQRVFITSGVYYRSVLYFEFY